MPLATRRAVFLDRDGTLNEDPGYLREPSQLKLFPGVTDALAELARANYLLVVVSNQSGVGRGLIEKEMIPRINARLDELLADASHGSAKIDHYELCFHRPDEACECRKPKPKLILDSAKLLGIELSRSYMIGDKPSDIAAGITAGCRASILVRTGEGSLSEPQLAKNGPKPGFIANSLREAAEWILNSETATP